MAIIDFNFEPYNEARLRHMQVHLEGVSRVGSFFRREVFPDAKSLADFAFSYLNEYEGRRTEIEIEMPYSVGYDGVIDLKKLNGNASVFKIWIQKKSFYLNFVKGVPKQQTNRLLIVAGPLREKGNLPAKIHGFYTIFPGTKAPPFPVSFDALKRSYDGISEKVLIENENRARFWEEHGLIIEWKMADKIKRSYEDRRLIGLARELRAQEERDKGYVSAFCRKFELNLNEINCTSENGRTELMYVFDDNLGGYTLDAVIGSLL